MSIFWYWCQTFHQAHHYIIGTDPETNEVYGECSKCGEEFVENGVDA